MDNNLNLVKEVQTIDTLRSLQHFIDPKPEDKHNSVLTNLKPKRVINEESYVADGFLYVLSKIKSDVEPIDKFRSNSIIDRYHVDNFSYEGSFYIPDYKDEKLWGFSITGKQLIGVYRNHLVLHYLP